MKRFFDGQKWKQLSTLTGETIEFDCVDIEWKWARAECIFRFILAGRVRPDGFTRWIRGGMVESVIIFITRLMLFAVCACFHLISAQREMTGKWYLNNKTNAVKYTTTNWVKQIRAHIYKLMQKSASSYLTGCIAGFFVRVAKLKSYINTAVEWMNAMEGVKYVRGIHQCFAYVQNRLMKKKTALNVS